MQGFFCFGAQSRLAACLAPLIPLRLLTWGWLRRVVNPIGHATEAVTVLVDVAQLCRGPGALAQDLLQVLCIDHLQVHGDQESAAGSKQQAQDD